MKKQLSVIIILLFSIFFSTVMAQDLDAIIKELAKMDGVVHQLLDKAALDAQLKNEALGEKMNDIPPFMDKVTEIEVVIIESGDAENEAFKKAVNFKAGSDYETLVKVKDDGSNVSIFSRKKDDTTSDVYVLVSQINNLIAVRMSGAFTTQDLTDIVNEQTKNNK